MTSLTGGSYPPPVVHDDLAPSDPGLSLVGLANTLLARRRIVIRLPIASALLAAVISLILPPTYTATTSFFPEQSEETTLPGMLSGLASQFGVPLAAEASQSPRFYQSLARSRELMEEVLLTRYPDPRAGATSRDSATLLVLLDVDGDDRADSILNGLRALENMVTIPVDAETSILSLNVRSRYPTVSAAVANRFVEALIRFNTETRQLQARQTRSHVERTMADAEAALRRAESEHRVFVGRNRLWEQSADLRSEESGMQREVYLKQEIYLGLQREYEGARIAEVNDTPAITVIDRGIPPRRRSHPRRKLMVMVAFALGTLVAVTLAFAADYAQRLHDTAEPEFQRFVVLVGRTWDDGRSGVRRILRFGRR